ncbi:pyruvate kinase [Pancytospora epiphaga]|nr:pyruvate kinase [Pancytospora epiphaga]
MKNRTKIICTLGPATNSYTAIEQLAENGMDIARLNFSHGSHKEHLQTISNIKKLRDSMNEYIYIGMDTRGPEIRVTLYDILNINRDDHLELITKEKYIQRKIQRNIIGVDIKRFNAFDRGDVIFIDDGKLELIVTNVNEDSLLTLARTSHLLETGKKLTSNKLTGSLNWLSDDDVEDIKFGLSNGVDMIFLSFVESPENIKMVRSLCGSSSVKLIAKIETEKGVEMVEEIASVCDGVMIARGDLGTNIGLGRLFSAQMRILELAWKLPVIMATEMILSMTDSETPTRAEISDIGNAVMSGCYAVMLSSETSIGKYPTQCVKMVREVVTDTERYLELKGKLNK